jgi:hypothetical protein
LIISLSADEIAGAQKAFLQNRSYDGRYRFWLPLIIVATSQIGPGIQARQQILNGLENGHLRQMDILTFVLFFALFFVGLPFVTLNRWWLINDLKSHYAGNQRVLENLKQRHGGELPPEFLAAAEYSQMEYPLPKYLREHFGKRPVLWRLDAFLSRKPARD